MAYSKTTWTDRVSQFPNRYTKQNENSTTVELIADEGVVTEQGTFVNASLMNKIEQGIADSIPLGANNAEIALVKSLIQPTHTRSVELVYTSGVLTSVLEKDGSTTLKTTTLNYTSGTLTSVVEVCGGTTTTTTLNYTSGTLTSVTRAVV